MRKCDHQAQRAVPVVQGLPEDEQSSGQFFELVQMTPRAKVGYGCNEGPAAQCNLGPMQ
jgi:hypothetical protein